MLKRIDAAVPMALAVIALAVLITACTTAINPLDDYAPVSNATVTATPEPLPIIDDQQRSIIEHGRYLVSLLACGSCHTDGALVGRPNDSRLLAGSQVGIAYSNPLATRFPGVVYPSNITPDAETGIGNWSTVQLVRMLQSGLDKHSQQSLPVMPWPSYVNLTDADATAIALYLKSLAPVRHKVPANVRPGQRASAPYVHVGLYQSRQ